MNEVTTYDPNNAWDPNSGDQLPAYLTDAASELGGNIPDRQSVPSLSYEGKTWGVSKNGEKIKLQAQNSDGDMIPIPIMRMVVLNFNADRGRAYYPGTYNPAQVSAPTCWSADGKAPDASVTDKQAAQCNACPLSVKGSKIQDGKEMVACSSHRMLAVVPTFDLNEDPLRLKIAVTSDYDKDIVEHGWYAFRQYADYLKSRGITHTGLVSTKVKFDSSVAYPKLLFAIDRVLTPDEIATITQKSKDPKVSELLAERWTAAGVDGKLANGADMRPKPTDPAHIHGAGTDAELWWDGDVWAKPWETQAAEPATPPPPPEPAATAEAPAKPKPTDPAHIHGAGTDAELWWDGAAWAKPWIAEGNSTGQPAAAQPTGEKTPAPTPAAEPAAAPAASPSKAYDPTAAAEADGWIAHPESPGYHYKGQEVVPTGDLAAKYPEADKAAPAAPATPAAAAGNEPAAADEIPDDVKELLGKWAG